MKIAVTSDTHYGHSRKTHQYHGVFLQKLADENFDLLVHNGDWISHKQHQLPRTLKMFREALGDRPILTTLGNHDLWCDDAFGMVPRTDKLKYVKPKFRGKTYRNMIIEQSDWFDEYNIHHLAWNPYQFEEEVMFYGWDGWYSQLPVNTNDKNFMPRLVDGNAPIDMFLSNEAHKAVDRILLQQEEYKKENPHLSYVACTHMPTYTKEEAWRFMNANHSFHKPITEAFNLFLVGHSHQDEDFRDNRCRIVNCGSDYDAPKFKIIDLP